MTNDDFKRMVSDSSETIIRLVCDGDYQYKNAFPRRHLTVAHMMEQYNDIKAWKGDEA